MCLLGPGPNPNPNLGVLLAAEEKLDLLRVFRIEDENVIFLVLLVVAENLVLEPQHLVGLAMNQDHVRRIEGADKVAVLHIINVRREGDVGHGQATRQPLADHGGDLQPHREKERKKEEEGKK